VREPLRLDILARIIVRDLRRPTSMSVWIVVAVYAWLTDPTTRRTSIEAEERP